MNNLSRIEFGGFKTTPLARKYIKEVLDNDWPCSGKMVLKFEEEWGKLFDYKYNKAMSSGTDAVINACLTLYDFGAEIGDFILVPSLSFIATANAVRAAGFVPLFVDIDLTTLNIDEKLIEQTIRNHQKNNTKKIVALIGVNTMGKPCKWDILRYIADIHRLKLICDNAEGHGCKYENKYMADWADMSTYSFYAAHLCVCGEGGMVSTQNEELSKILASTRTHGRKDGALYFDHIRFGLNSKMNDMEAALGLSAIPPFWKVFKKRKDNYYKLQKEIAEKYIDKAWFSWEDENAVNCPHGWSITLNDDKPILMKNLQTLLDKANIHWKVNFGSLPTTQKAFQYLNYKYGHFPNAEWVAKCGLHIGIHQFLTQNDLDRIIETFNQFFKENY